MDLGLADIQEIASNVVLSIEPGKNFVEEGLLSIGCARTTPLHQSQRRFVISDLTAIIPQ